MYQKYSQLFQVQQVKKAELVNLMENKQYDAHL